VEGIFLPELILLKAVISKTTPAYREATGVEDMTLMTHPIVVFSAALGLLALTETAGDAAFSVENQVPMSQFGAPRIPSRVEVRRAADGSPVLVRVNSPPDEDATDAYPPFTCAQLQVIDEVEFSNEEAGASDCDANAD
jgi:hypothetical protein